MNHDAEFFVVQKAFIKEDNQVRSDLSRILFSLTKS